MYLGSFQTNAAALIAAAISAQRNAVTVQSEPTTVVTMTPNISPKAAKRAARQEKKAAKAAQRIASQNRVTVKLPPMPSSVAPVLTARRASAISAPRTPKPAEGGGGGGGGSGAGSGGGGDAVIVGAPVAPVAPAKEGGVIPFAIGFGLLSLLF